MERTIKFRAKRLDNGEWAYGYPMKNEFYDKWYIFSPQGMTGTTGAEVNPDSIGQYTGLKDRNGKEIYEGDIIEVAGGDKRVVLWGKTSLALMPCGYYYDKDMWEIRLERPQADWWEDYAKAIEKIGNLWENPEMLG